MNKTILEKRQSRIEAKIADAKTKLNATEDVAEARSLVSAIEDMNVDLDEVREELAMLAEEEARTAATKTAVNPIAAYGVRDKVDSDIEYRKAFMNYVQKNAAIPTEMLTARAAEHTVVGDITPVFVPQTVLNEFIKAIPEGAYGQLYNLVRHTKITGGVNVGISDLSATFKWQNEATSQDAAKAGTADSFISFSYFQGEIKISTSLIAYITALDEFETELARVIAEAFMKEMDRCIIAGAGTTEPLGITQDPRVTNVVEFTATQISDWKAWHKQLFAKIPLSKRGKGVFVFTNATLESDLETISNDNGDKIFKANFDDSAVAGTFYGRKTILVESDILHDYDDAVAGDVFGVYFDPSQYCINSNLDMTITKYFNHDTNCYETKLLVVMDGKILDASGCYILKKK